MVLISDRHLAVILYNSLPPPNKCLEYLKDFSACKITDTRSLLSQESGRNPLDHNTLGCRDALYFQMQSYIIIFYWANEKSFIVNRKMLNQGFGVFPIVLIWPFSLSSISQNNWVYCEFGWDAVVCKKIGEGYVVKFLKRAVFWSYKVWLKSIWKNKKRGAWHLSFFILRKGGDSNPWSAVNAYSLSRRASSTTRAPFLSLDPVRSVVFMTVTGKRLQKY